MPCRASASRCRTQVTSNVRLHGLYSSHLDGGLRMYRPLACALFVLLICQGCGGTPKEEPIPIQSEYERLIEEASAKRNQVEALIQDTPCTEHSHCSTLTLNAGLPCAQREYVYSLISSTASAASAAASEFNSLSIRASALQPPSNVSTLCIESVRLQLPGCIANKCVK
jgi:hypothetical protein